MTTQTKPVFEPKTQAFINAVAAQGRKLIEAGIEVTALRVLATHHDFAIVKCIGRHAGNKINHSSGFAKSTGPISAAA